MNESHLAPDDLLLPVAPEIADPGELVAVPGLPHGLWVKPLGRGKRRIETIAFEPTPYQFGDVIDYDGPVGERRLKGLWATGGFETVWFDLSPERGASAPRKKADRPRYDRGAKTNADLEPMCGN